MLALPIIAIALAATALVGAGLVPLFWQRVENELRRRERESPHLERRSEVSLKRGLEGSESERKIGAKPLIRRQVGMLRNLGLVDLLKRTFEEIGKDHVASFAGALTYSGFLSIFPFSIFLLSLLGLFGAPNLLINSLDKASTALPATESAFLRDQILSIAQSRAQGAFTLGAIIAILVALWGISGAFRTMMDAMNVMYEVEEGRPFWKLYPISIFISVGVAVLLVIALGLVTFGPQVARTIAGYSGSLGTIFVWVWYVLQWPVLFCLVLLAFALVYYFAPDVEQRFRYISPGSVTAALLWVGFSFLFSLYVNNFGSFNASYGALAGVVVLLLYIYYSSFILLVGAELNQVIEERSPEGKDKGEKMISTREERHER